MTQPRTRPDVEELVHRYAGLIRLAVRRVAGPRAEEIAEDVEQQVALNLLRRMESSEQIIRHPASYLYRAAVREAVRAIREERRRYQGRVFLEDREVEDPVVAQEGSELRDTGREIMKAMAGLQPKRRRAVAAHLMGFTVQEIMEMWGWSYNTARNLISRGMADLRAELGKRGIHG